MAKRARDNYLNFRGNFFLIILTLLLVTAFPLKFLNLLLAYIATAGESNIEDVPGLALTRLAHSVNWETALNLGFAGTCSVLVAIFLLKFISFRKVRPIARRAKAQISLKGEASVYFLLFTSSSVLGSFGIIAAGTLANLTFGPLLMFSVLNPKWETQYIRARFIVALLIVTLTFTSIGSKTVILYFIVALLYHAFFVGRNFIPAIIFGFAFVVVYPYLNVLRGLFGMHSLQDSSMIVSLMISSDFNQTGIISMLVGSYDAFLGRLVGLDGLIVAAPFVDTDIRSAQDISYALIGWEGIGIALSALGSLSVALDSTFLSFIVFPFLAALIWRGVKVLDFYMTALGFSSFGVFLYMKAILMLIGGFSWTEIKLIGFSTSLVILIGIVISISLSRRKQKYNITRP
jgi:hypothetical protein